MTAERSLQPRERGIPECSSSGGGGAWLWSKCSSDKLGWCEWGSGTSCDWREGGVEAMVDVGSSIAKCFLVPVWWGASSSSSASSSCSAAAGVGAVRIPQHDDGVQTHLVLSHGVSGPSARFVLWKNYTGFDCRGARRNLGALIRAHDAKRKHLEVEEVENENQSFLGSMLGTALSKYVNSQLDHCGELDIRVAGSNRDILKGQLKKVRISAKQVIYKGVALSDVDLSARSIQITMGKSRVLRDPLHIKAHVSICEKDLKASLVSPLLAVYLEDLLPEALRGEKLAGVQVGMTDGVVHLTEGNELKLLRTSHHNETFSSPTVALSFDLKNEGRTVLINHEGEGERRGSGTSIDVGSKTNIRKLGVVDSRLVIGGEFLVIPY